MKFNFKKVVLLLVTVFFISYVGIGQVINLQYKSEMIKDGVYLLSIKASIEKYWHIYSQASHEDGPIPTKISFNAHPLIKLKGITNEKGKKIKHYEKVFNFYVEYYEDSVEFSQTIKVNSKKKIKTNVTGTIEYMLCTDGKCLPPTKEKFSIEIQ